MPSDCCPGCGGETPASAVLVSWGLCRRCIHAGLRFEAGGSLMLKIEAARLTDVDIEDHIATVVAYHRSRAPRPEAPTGLRKGERVRIRFFSTGGPMHQPGVVDYVAVLLSDIDDQGTVFVQTPSGSARVPAEYVAQRLPRDCCECGEPIPAEAQCFAFGDLVVCMGCLGAEPTS